MVMFDALLGTCLLRPIHSSIHTPKNPKMFHVAGPLQAPNSPENHLILTLLWEFHDLGEDNDD